MLLALLVAASAGAQTTGSVTGTVSDSSGGRIPGATVVLINEAQATRSTPVITNNQGVYTFPTVVPGTYSVEASLSGFQTVVRKGLAISRGDRVQVENLSLVASAVTASIDVMDAAPLVQAASGERSSTVARQQLENLPSATGSADHNWLGYINLQPGVVGNNRIGGGGQANYMLDGLSAMDTGNNGLMGGMNLPIDAVAEIKVVTSGYSAEYGRSSGLQVSAITRSGTNRFHGSVYDYERDSDWNANSWQNQANGVARPTDKQRDWGYTIGGPVGKPGGDNKLFFFYTHEFRPRTSGGAEFNYRMPTALERLGDFSQTRDNNNALYPYIYDAARGAQLGVPSNKAACSATNQTQCFQDGGVIGKIPMNRLYGPGMAWLNSYPLPNNVPPTTGSSLGYNHTVESPITHPMEWTPNVKVDYQMLSSLRLTWRVSARSARVIPANQQLPEWTPTVQNFPLAFNTSWAVNYTLNPTTFVEGSYGWNQNRLGSPSIAYYSDRANMVCPAGLASQVADCTGAAFPLLFPNAGQMNTGAYEYGAIREIQDGKYDVPFMLPGEEPCLTGDEIGQTCGRMNLPPNMNWGSTRLSNAPPSIGYPGFMNINRIQQTQLSVTKILGNHNAKAGFYFEHSYKAQNAQNNINFNGRLDVSVDTGNPLDTQMAFSNMATGIFSSFAQATRFLEGNWAYNNIEFYLQDNWKVTPRLTLDYGARFVHQTPNQDKFNHVANFFQGGNENDELRADVPADALYDITKAPYLYVPGCVNNTPTCSGANRVAKDPRTNTPLPKGSQGLVGSVILNSGDDANGMIVGGQLGTHPAGYTWPAFAVAPRVGAAYDVSGDQRMVLRGAVGLYFDRPDGNTNYQTILNPPIGGSLTQQWGDLRSLSNPTFQFGPVPNLRTNEYDSLLPSDVQWNAGVQRVLPWASSIDVAYVGHHQPSAIQLVNFNTIDLGTTFLDSSQDPTNATRTPLSNNLLRPIRGYGDIQINQWRFKRDFHSIQFAVTRNFRDGFAFGLTDTWTLSDTGTVGLPNGALRIDHNADGSWQRRADQKEYEELFKDQGTRSHVMVANFTYDLPDAHPASSIMKGVAAVINDWQLSGIMSIDSGTPYTPGYSYQSGPTGQALTGSPNFTARPTFTDLAAFGSGCSGNQYQQLGNTIVSSGLDINNRRFISTNTIGPQVGSDALESGRNQLTSCKDHIIDLAIQRTIKLGGSRSLQLRADLFNAFNTLVYTGRSSTVQFNSATDQTVRVSQYLQDGTLDPARVKPNQAGFGAATAASALRSVQGQIRYTF
jgi:hypothetical protein